MITIQNLQVERRTNHQIEEDGEDLWDLLEDLEAVLEDNDRTQERN